jgi:hypothetical protein
MCGYQVINLRQPSILGRIQDASRIAGGVGATVARVDEQRFTGWAYKEGCVTAFDIDNVNLKRSCLRLGCRDTAGKGHNEHNKHSY